MAVSVEALLGFSYPLRRGGRGYWAKSAGADRVDEAIRQVLGTIPGERVMRPSFGCRIHLRPFQPNDTKLSAEAKQDIRDALAAWVPYIIVESIDGVRLSTHQLQAVVRYQVGRTGPAQTFDDTLNLRR